MIQFDRIVGVDPATNTGICIIDKKRGIRVDSYTLNKDVPYHVALSEFFEFFALGVGQLKDQPTTLWAVESIQALSFARAQKRAFGMSMGNELRGVLFAAIGTLDPERNKLITCQPARLKKFATGNGRATKKDMIQAAQRQTGYKPANSDEADAIFLALWADANKDTQELDAV